MKLFAKLRDDASLRILLAILALVFVKQLAWLTAMPLWHTPDEDAHYQYVEYLAETGRLPIFTRATPLNQYSQEVVLSLQQSGVEEVKFRPPIQPILTSSTTGPGEERFSQQPRLSRSSDGNSSAAVYAPGYYFPAALAYRAVEDGTLMDRVFAVRAVSIGFVLLTTFLAFQLAGLLWSNLYVRAGFALFVGMHPVLSFLGVSVNNDAMLVALGSAALVYLAYALKTGFSFRQGLVLGFVLGFGLLAKPQMMWFVLVTPFLAALAALYRRDSWKRLIRYGLGVGLSVAMLYGPWLAYCKLTYGTWVPSLIASEGQQAMSLLEFIGTSLSAPGLERAFHLWIISYWANLGWHDTYLAHPVYLALAAFMFLGGIGTLITIFREKDLATLITAASACLALGYLVFLYYAEFQVMRLTGAALLQGRYWLPVILPISAVCFGGLLALLPKERRVQGGVALALASILLNLLTLLRMIERYYA